MVTGVVLVAKGFSAEQRVNGSSWDENDGRRADGGRAPALKPDGKETGGGWCVRVLGGRW
jgi:hypothetical protein